MEMWKEIKNYEGRYEVSDRGKVRSVNRIANDSMGRNRHLRGNILNGTIDTSGYRVIMLSKQEKRRDDRIPKRVHVLISENFLGPRPTLQHETNHKNGNKLDNRLANLEWITKSENGKHAWKLKLNHGSSKKIIRSDGEVFNSLAEAARSMKGTLASVCHVLHGRLQTYKGFTFSYSEEKSWR